MAEVDKMRRPKLRRCPLFRPVIGTEGREEHCKVTREGVTFRVVRYRKSGRLVAWIQPHGRPSFPGMELPVSTPPTRSLDDLMYSASKFARSRRRSS